MQSGAVIKKELFGKSIDLVNHIIAQPNEKAPLPCSSVASALLRSAASCSTSPLSFSTASPDGSRGHAQGEDSSRLELCECIAASFPAHGGQALLGDAAERPPRLACTSNSETGDISSTYQWLSWAQAGPDTIQFHAMTESLKIIARRLHLDMAGIYVWLDIPQQNQRLKALAVKSLYTYARGAM